MRNLFIDSSRKSLSIAVTSHDELLFVSNVMSYSKHSNYLLNEIKNILEKTNIKITEIDNIIILNGPGSFTGIRVGVTVAKTLAWSLNKKIYVLNNLFSMKIGIKDDIVISIIYDKDNSSYAGIYEDNTINEGYFNIDSEVFNYKNKNITLVAMEDNNFINDLYNKLSKENIVNKKIIKDYDYLSVVNYAIDNESINVHNVKPIYLKKIDVEK